MTTKSKGSSVRQKLTDLSQKIRVPYQNLEMAFMIERLVARLYQSHLGFPGKIKN